MWSDALPLAMVLCAQWRGLRQYPKQFAPGHPKPSVRHSPRREGGTRRTNEISSPSGHSVSPEPDAGVSVSEIEVRVRDTGTGIGIARQANLFDRTSIIEDRRGSGLGLPFAELIMDALGGKIGLERSVAGVGSVFLLKRPGVGTGRTIPPCPYEIMRDTEPASSSLPKRASRRHTQAPRSRHHPQGDWMHHRANNIAASWRNCAWYRTCFNESPQRSSRRNLDTAG